jgi:hypothetical protein
MHLLRWRLQTDQLNCRRYGAFVMMKDCKWCDQFYRGRFGTFTIIEGCGPITHCGDEGLIVALHGIHDPKALCGKMLIIILHNIRGQLLLWQEAGLIVAHSLVANLGKGFVIAFTGKRLVVALLDRCILLGVLAILALGNARALFGVLTVLAFDNIHAFGVIHAISSVLTVLDLGVFVPLIIALRNMVIIASCE